MHPRLQLLTVGELLAGKAIDYPRTTGVNRTNKQAPRVLRKVAKPHPELFSDRPWSVRVIHAATSMSRYLRRANSPHVEAGQTDWHVSEVGFH